MLLLVAIGFFVVILLVTVALVSPSEDERYGCNDDIPCQECGLCYGDHINAVHGANHTYKYPRDLHR